MEIKRLSLCDHMNSLNGGEAPHQEYDGAIIRSMAHMPIIQYLGYNDFYNLHRDMEVWVVWEYQAVTRVIADRTRPPETMSQIENLLDAPIVQIEEAYR